MKATGRDLTLDLLKGSGCLLMIMAHSALRLKGYDEFTFYGGLAPVVFFGPAAVTASFQAVKYQPRGVLLGYAFLFLLGFSFNRITDVGFLGELEMDMLQIIALGSAVIYLLEYHLRLRLWLYLLLGVLIFAAKFLVQELLRGIAISGVTNLIVPPGVFPIFPWLFLFPMGLVAYRARNTYNLVFALASTVIALALKELGVVLLIRNKWDMTIGYFLVCTTLLFASIFLLRAVPYFQKPRGLGWLLFLGRNSLLFLYVHFPLVLYFKEVRNIRTVPSIREYPFMFWLFILALTMAIMLGLLYAARWRWLSQVFDRLPAWVVMIGLVFGVGLLVPNSGLVYNIEIGLGVLTALFFNRLVRVLKGKPVDLAPKEAAEPARLSPPELERL